jgi:hypothetical protein
MRRTTKVLSAAVLFGFAATAMAQAAENDPSVGGQLNQCWGQMASQTAKLPTPEGTKGGGMGQHSRSTQAADKNGGFANSNNAFGITFNTDGGRDGVGNVSKGDPHNAHPGDGGNGQHAINNSSDNVNGIGFATILDPVNGQLVGAGGTAHDLGCDLVP